MLHDLVSGLQKLLKLFSVLKIVSFLLIADYDFRVAILTDLRLEKIIAFVLSLDSLYNSGSEFRQMFVIVDHRLQLSKLLVIAISQTIKIIMLILKSFIL